MITGILVLLVLFLLVRIIRKNWKKIMGTIDNLIYSSNSEELSEKYKSLHLFKSFLGICIILNIVLCIIGCFIIWERFLSPFYYPILILYTLINIYVLINIQMMVGFLFDLNKKTDN